MFEKTMMSWAGTVHSGMQCWPNTGESIYAIYHINRIKKKITEVFQQIHKSHFGKFNKHSKILSKADIQENFHIQK